MRRLRFTIGSLLVVVVFVAVTFAALREATDIWDAGVFGVTLLTLLTAVLLAVHRSEPSRAFWLGFALFGWMYLIASLVPSVESRLPTTKGLVYLDSKVPGRSSVFTVTFTSSGSNVAATAVQALAFSTDGSTLATKSPGAVRLWNTTSGKLLAGPYSSSESFVRIGHSLLSLIMA